MIIGMWLITSLLYGAAVASQTRRMRSCTLSQSNQATLLAQSGLAASHAFEWIGDDMAVLLGSLILGWWCVRLFIIFFCRCRMVVRELHFVKSHEYNLVKQTETLTLHSPNATEQNAKKLILALRRYTSQASVSLELIRQQRKALGQIALLWFVGCILTGCATWLK